MGSAPSKPVPHSSKINEKDSRFSSSAVSNITSDLGQLTLKQRQPVSQDGSLVLSGLKDWERKAAEDKTVRLGRAVLVQNALPSSLLVRPQLQTNPHVFNTVLPFVPTPITSQNSSGRCWLFASTNLLRYTPIQALSLDSFQLSQNYLFFYDKLEKSNFFLENVIELVGLEKRGWDDRTVQFVLQAPAADGGQWDMVVNVLETYGIVPREMFEDSFTSGMSSPFNTVLTTRLRSYASELAGLARQLESNDYDKEAVIRALRVRKEEMMQEVWRMITAVLGVPPSPDEPFKWEYLDKDGKAHAWEGTPREFYRKFKSDKYPPGQSFSLIHDPRNQYNKLYTVDRLGNVRGGRPVLYVNTEINRLKQHVVRCIKAGHPVFFGCDVGKSVDRTSGVMDVRLYDYETPFALASSPELTKTSRLQLGESAMTHAMVISGVHVDTQTGRPVRFKVENSWGEDAGKKGWFVMSEEWFDEFVYQVVVPRQLADRDLINIFDGGKRGEVTVLPAWDPMGALA